MLRALSLCLVAALAGCSRPTFEVLPPGDYDSGGDADPSEGCNDDAQCPFGQICVSGTCTTQVDPRPTGCTSDDDCPAGHVCAVSRPVCVPVAPIEEPQDETEPECLDGATRDCGSKVGACTYGSEACVGGQWSGVCEGGTGPVTEPVCNGEDDDCDGVLGPEELDVDGDGHMPCEGDCQDDDPLIHPGATEVCNGDDDDCNTFFDEGTDDDCDDQLFCTGVETCTGGQCVPGTAPSCTAFDDACHVGACDEGIDGCGQQPRTDGTTCDDGQHCTVGESCQAGACGGGAPRDCSSAADACNVGVCDEDTDACVPDPKPDNAPCSDGEFCTDGDTCQIGVCTPGLPLDCAATGCRDGTCDEATDTCVGGAAINEGLPCDDGLFCTVGDLCTAGTCGGPTPRDCQAAVGDACNDGVCDAAAELNDACTVVPVTNGSGCSDGQFCTDGDTCQAGACAPGPLRDCSAVQNACNLGVCQEATDQCVPQPRADGTTCNDGLYCTVTDGCQAGTCTGPARNCSTFTNACNLGVCNEAGDTCQPQPVSNGTPCSDGQYCTEPDTCQTGACSAGPPRDCSALDDACHDGTCNETSNVCEAVETGACACDPAVDGDFDGADECDDCDDTNGAVFPNADERCNGIDDDCDDLIDEDFDVDTDTYSVCAIDPLLFDCNDDVATINPGMAESCGPTGNGNGIDENCNGYVDEICNCDPVDDDGDGFSECQGDCDDQSDVSFPNATETCDGLDNDCNALTIDNCDVSEPCNWPSGEDVCADDLLCACIVNAAGSCTGDYQCTSYCNTSQTGATGDGCTSTQTCALDLLRSANVHGCDESPTTPGTKVGGLACTVDSECRSNVCARLFIGPGQKDYCYDYCGSDAYCPAAGTVCRLARATDNMDGRCWPTGRPGVGSTAVGATCTSDGQCDHGFCGDEGNDGGTKRCTEACCRDSDCGAGYHCSLRGDQIPVPYAYPPPGGPACAATPDCPSGMVCLTASGQCAWQLAETAPMCFADVSGQSNRPAGAACTLNRECQSNFCEASLSVCVDVCCSDAACPTGLTCELQTVRTAGNYVTASRVCVNLTTDAVLMRK